MMHLKRYWLLFLMSGLISACSEVDNPKYKDTSALELPPVMEIAETPHASQENAEETENTGLGDVVSISGSTEHPVIKIKKMFDRSWDIVEQSLALSEIEITDKNRDKGIFYVKFDPDRQRPKDSGFLEKMGSFLFEDDYKEAAYKITVVWRESDTEVSAELIGQADNELLDKDDDDDFDFEDTIDSGGKLIEALYKTIRDDLPID